MRTWNFRISLFVAVAVLLNVQASELEVSSNEELSFIDEDNHQFDVTCDNDCKLLAATHENTSESIEDLKKEVIFYLYTRNGVNQLFVGDSETLLLSHFNPLLPTRLVTHGWKSSVQSDNLQRIKSNYLEEENCNVIGIDWMSLADPTLSYCKAMSNTKKVGRYIASFIDFLVHETNINLANVHLIGHSLGGHVMGIAGRNIMSGKVGRITGLDPAGFCYLNIIASNRLTSDDANFVEVIHTCTTSSVGFKSPCGNVDFYPNGGTSQPGCGKGDGLVCSHSRAWEYFAESIKSERFVAHLCDSYANYKAGKCNNKPRASFGYSGPTSQSGSYYLTTNAVSPYAQG